MNWFTQKRIVVPFDFSDESVEAIKVALTLAERKEDVHVIHVLTELSVGDPYAVWDEMSDEHREEYARKSMSEKLADLDIETVHLDVRIGNASQKIADLANEIVAGLIVIPSHGRTGVKRFLLGSVTERVVRLAHCPVLVLKNSTQKGP